MFETTMFKTRIFETRMFETRRFKLVELKLKLPFRFFWRFSPVVPRPLMLASAISVPETWPLRSGWNELTSGAMGTF